MDGVNNNLKAVQIAAKFSDTNLHNYSLYLQLCLNGVFAVKRSSSAQYAKRLHKRKRKKRRAVTARLP
jgi:L-rhamnose mutarotase